jgi:hypothetical protein
MRYIPSPISIKYDVAYTATANKSGRMQYHKIRPGQNKLRISRTEFIKAYNSYQMIAVQPIQVQSNETDFQIEFYI